MNARDAVAQEQDQRLRREALARLQQLLDRVERARAESRSLAQGRRARAARRPRGARRHAAAAVQEGLRRERPPAEGGAGRADAESAGAARRRRLAALGERRHPGAALREDGGARGARGSGGDRAADPRAAAAVASGGRRAARAGRRAVEALQGGARRGVDALRSALRRAGRGARRQPREEGRALRARRSARRLDATGSRPPTRSRRCRPSGRRSARCRAARRRRSGSASARACDRFFTRRHADLAAAQGGLGGEPREERGALREGRSAGRIDRLGRGGRRDQAAAGRVEDDRPGEEDAGRRRSGSGSAAPAISFFARYAQRHDIARGERVAAREAICRRASKRRRQPRRLASRAPTPDAAAPADLLARVARAAVALAAGDRRARRRSRARRGARRALRRGVRRRASPAGRRRSAAPISIPTANRKKMEALVRRIEELADVAGRPARRGRRERCRRPRGWRRC